MNPINSSQGGDELGPIGPTPPQNNHPQDPQSAAANVIRGQIDALYGGRPVAEREPAPVATSTPTSQTLAADTTNPYNRTHSAHPLPQAEQWKEYHSAWQTYYQKYYEAYYEHQRKQQATQAEAVQASQPQADATTGFFSSQQATAQPTPVQHDTEDITKDEALFELRQRLLTKVRGQAQKIRGSKHFIPIVAALSVVLIFVFLQYNRVFIATVNAYVSPGSVDPQNIVIDPSTNSAVSADPRLIIPKINVDVPAIYDTTPDHDAQMAAMEKGVAHFGIAGANSRPGEVGNTVLSGHSSNDLFDSGDYKFIFAQLEKLNKGDTVYANYEGVRYTYVVTKMEVVKPTQVSALVYPTDKPILTLITCTPLGTAQNRLLVTAEQISPDPAKAHTAPAGSGTASQDSEAIPGSSATLLERLFGAR